MNTRKREKAESSELFVVSHVLTVVLSVNLNKTMLFSSENQAFSSGRWPTEEVSLQKRKEHSCNFKLKCAITVLYCCQLKRFATVAYVHV